MNLKYLKSNTELGYFANRKKNNIKYKTIIRQKSITKIIMNINIFI